MARCPTSGSPTAAAPFMVTTASRTRRRSTYRKEHENNVDKIDQEVEGAGQRLQERKAAAPDERQEGNPDQEGPTHAHGSSPAHRRMGMSENLADLAVRPNAPAPPCR